MEKRPVKLFAAVVAFAALALFFFIYTDIKSGLEHSDAEALFFRVEGKETGKSKKETIQAWKKGETYYLFLPSYADLSNTKLSTASNGFTLKNTGEKIKAGVALDNLTINTEIPCVFNRSNKPFTLVVMQSKNLPTIFIATESGDISQILNNKEKKQTGTITVIEENGNLNYENGLDYIKGRGNYSWDHYDKKPFSISIKKNASLLSLKQGKTYALISNASDPTLLRNDLVRGMEEELQLRYSHRGEFVDLYIDGQYQGNYYLIERIEIATNRIEITNMEETMDRIYNYTDYDSFDNYERKDRKAKELEAIPQDITGGYLLEREFEDRYRLEYPQNASCMVTQNNEHFIVKSPEYCSKEQIDYLTDFMNEAESAIVTDTGINPQTGRNYQDYIDIDSFVKKYLTEEVSKNYDAGVSSAFYYKDSDLIDTHLYAGPGWDYDMTLGNYLGWMEYFSADPRGISRLSLHDHATSWYDILYDKKEFYQKIQSYYRGSVSPYLEQLLTDRINDEKERLQASADMDYTRWQKQYCDNPYFISREKSFEELRYFVKERKEFLDSAWIDGVKYHIITYKNNDVPFGYDYIRDGATIQKMPQVEHQDIRWYDEATGKNVTTDTVITADMVLRCN